MVRMHEVHEVKCQHATRDHITEVGFRCVTCRRTFTWVNGHGHHIKSITEMVLQERGIDTDLLREFILEVVTK
jgi:hypothetical protein